MYSLSLPVMLLLGEGAAAAGLVAGVQEALGKAAPNQPLVIYMPRIEVRAACNSCYGRQLQVVMCCRGGGGAASLENGLLPLPSFPRSSRRCMQGHPEKAVFVWLNHNSTVG